jgi:hypothetical protein
MALGRFTLVLFTACVAITFSPVSSQFEAAAKKRSKPVYCELRAKPPPGCIDVPPEAKTKGDVKPYQKPTKAPPETVNGGGVGGGGGRREEGAIDWAGGFMGSPEWAYRDVSFVETAYAAKSPRFVSAHQLRRHVYLHSGSPTHAPVGTLMFFRSDPFNRYLGRVGLSQGNGTMLSALDVVRRIDVADVKYWSEAYLGWSHAPRQWRGRLPVPFDIIGPVDPDSARIVSPAFDEFVHGPVLIEATAPVGAHLEFAVYFSEDPVHAPPTWHDLGPANSIGTMHVLQWDSAPIPDQGDPDVGTVSIAAIAVDAAGNRNVGDYRRVTVDNVP